MDFLVFQLQGPMAAWGDTAVGEFRPSLDAPGLSSLVGLLGAALGLRREDEPPMPRFVMDTVMRWAYRLQVGCCGITTPPRCPDEPA